MLSGACTYASPTCFTIPAGYAIVKEGYSLDMREKLTSLRIENGFSQQELAERLNVTRQAISMWESGATIPSIDSLILLSKLYGVSVDEFLGLASGKEDEEAKAEAPANAGKSPRRLLIAAALLLAALVIAVSAYLMWRSESDAEVTEAYNLYELNETDVPDVDDLNILPWSEK